MNRNEEYGEFPPVAACTGSVNRNAIKSVQPSVAARTGGVNRNENRRCRKRPWVRIPPYPPAAVRYIFVSDCFFRAFAADPFLFDTVSANAHSTANGETKGDLNG